MSKLQKKTMQEVGWLGSSGYQTIVYSPVAAKTSTADSRVPEKSTTKSQTVPQTRATR